MARPDILVEEGLLEIKASPKGAVVGDCHSPGQNKGTAGAAGVPPETAGALRNYLRYRRNSPLPNQVTAGVCW